MIRHLILITYGEPPTPAFRPQLKYSWRILLGLTRSVAAIPPWLLPVIALSRARTRWRLWTRERYTSPLEPVTLAQAEGIARSLAESDPATDWRVHVAYEFRDPLLTDVLDRLPGHEPVDVLPMYVADSAFAHEISRVTVAGWLRRFRGGRAAPVRVLPALPETVLGALSAAHIERQIRARGVGGREWALVLAAHGTLLDPPRPMETGRESTERLCAEITRSVAGRFGAVFNGWLNHTRGGRWTEPPVEEALRQAAAAGYQRVVYYPYGFSADNAESELEGRIALRAHAWRAVVHLPCLNADASLHEALAQHVIAMRDGGADRAAEPVARAAG
jgi:ferrochelatase